jgi:hypothetical protein
VAEYRDAQQKGLPRKKVLPADKVPGLSPEVSVDPASFRGVVWRKPDSSNERNELYEPGDGGRVALLGNWREVLTQSLSAQNGSLRLTKQ